MQTIDKLLLRSRDGTTEVGTVLSAVFLCVLPRVPVSEVPAEQCHESAYENTYFMHYAARQVQMVQSAAVSMSRITQGYEEVMQMDEAPVVAGKYIVAPFIFTVQPCFHRSYL